MVRSQAPFEIADAWAGATAAVKCCERLAAIDLETVDPSALLRAIEVEAVRLFDLDTARIEAGGRLRDGGHIARTPTGLVIQLPHARLVGEGQIREGWETQARLFAAQVASVLKAHSLLSANESRQAELTALYASVGQLTAKLDVEGVLTTVVDRARELLASDIAYIMLLDAGGETLRMRVVTGNRTPSFASIRRPVRPGVSTAIGAPVQTSDYLNETALDHDPETDRQARLEGIRSVLAVPLTTELSVLGSLLVANRQVKTFSEREVSLLASLAEHAALALDNARLYEEAVGAANAATEARAEAEAHLTRLRRVDELHHRLTEVLLAGNGVSGVAENLASAFPISLVITDWRHRVLARAPAGTPARRADPGSESFLRRRDVTGALAACAADYSTVRVADDYLVTPIAARREVLGYIWAGCPTDEDAVAILKTSIEQASRVVALEMLREREAIETERRLRRDFMYELLAEKAPDLAVLESRARQVWARLGIAHRPLVISVAAAGNTGGNPVERGRRLVTEDRPSDFVTVHGRHLIALTPRVKRAEALQEVAEIRNLLANNGIRASISVGRSFRTLLEARDSILAARSLLDLLAPRDVVWAEGLEPLTLLFNAGQRDRLNAFAAAALSPLESREQLMVTLQAYYEMGGNRARAARRLGIHVNTFRQRLERIEELIGGSVDESAHAVPLRLALLAKGIATGQAPEPD
jgi:DNA-binding PucR family transcriptional regulator